MVMNPQEAQRTGEQLRRAKAPGFGEIAAQGVGALAKGFYQSMERSRKEAATLQAQRAKLAGQKELAGYKEALVRGRPMTPYQKSSLGIKGGHLNIAGSRELRAIGEAKDKKLEKRASELLEQVTGSFLGETPGFTPAWKEGFKKSEMPMIMRWLKDNPDKELPPEIITGLRTRAGSFIDAAKASKPESAQSPNEKLRMSQGKDSINKMANTLMEFSKMAKGKVGGKLQALLQGKDLTDRQKALFKEASAMRQISITLKRQLSENVPQHNYDARKVLELTLRDPKIRNEVYRLMARIAYYAGPEFQKAPGATAETGLKLKQIEELARHHEAAKAAQAAGTIASERDMAGMRAFDKIFGVLFNDLMLPIAR